MKTFDLKSAGLSPLTPEEERNISGGFWIQILGGAIAVAVGTVVRDWDNFKAGLAGQPERIK
ncbi:hypothetical protein WBG78_22425 [Chryseolinea sp. T2]|uniref:hypothetical protein n=1 Tax=Chryseolinea sp. T2 TaxID=3129255 RepID=UPI0030772F88